MFCLPNDIDKKIPLKKTYPHVLKLQDPFIQREKILRGDTAQNLHPLYQGVKYHPLDFSSLHTCYYTLLSYS